MNFRKTSLAIASIIIPGVMVLSQGLTQAQALVGLDGGGGPVIPPVTPPVVSHAPQFVTNSVLPDGVAGERYKAQIAIFDKDKNDQVTMGMYVGPNSTFQLTNCRNKYTADGSSLHCTLTGKLNPEAGEQTAYIYAYDQYNNHIAKAYYINAR